jgi:hypothetical protein
MVIRSLVALSAFLTAALAAAEPGSVVRGAVKDDSGLVLPGVRVELDSVEASFSRSASTDAKGSYQIAGLPAGRYRLSFRLPSFATSVKNVSLEAGAEGQVDKGIGTCISGRPGHGPLRRSERGAGASGGALPGAGRPTGAWPVGEGGDAGAREGSEPRPGPTPSPSSDRLRAP